MIDLPRCIIDLIFSFIPKTAVQLFRHPVISDTVVTPTLLYNNPYLIRAKFVNCSFVDFYDLVELPADTSHCECVLEMYDINDYHGVYPEYETITIKIDIMDAIWNLDLIKDIILNSETLKTLIIDTEYDTIKLSIKRSKYYQEKNQIEFLDEEGKISFILHENGFYDSNGEASWIYDFHDMEYYAAIPDNYDAHSYYGKCSDIDVPDGYGYVYIHYTDGFSTLRIESDFKEGVPKGKCIVYNSYYDPENPNTFKPDFMYQGEINGVLKGKGNYIIIDLFETLYVQSDDFIITKEDLIPLSIECISDLNDIMSRNENKMYLCYSVNSDNEKYMVKYYYEEGSLSRIEENTKYGLMITVYVNGEQKTTLHTEKYDLIYDEEYGDTIILNDEFKNTLTPAKIKESFKAYQEKYKESEHTLANFQNEEMIYIMVESILSGNIKLYFFEEYGYSHDIYHFIKYLGGYA